MGGRLADALAARQGRILKLRSEESLQYRDEFDGITLQYKVICVNAPRSEIVARGDAYRLTSVSEK
jgi:hypothetical protein